MITKINHIGIAVRRLERRLPFWAEALGLDVAGMETVGAEQVKVAFLPTGESRIELLESTSDGSPVHRFLDKRGEGIHHLALETSNIDALIERVRESGIKIVGAGAHRGAGGRPVAFLHPRSTGGVLIELVEGSARGSQAGTIGPGACVLVYLREPAEKLWGLLRRLDGAGVVVEAIDLASFDDWVAQVERRDENVVGPSLLFLPMSRVEKIMLDRSSGDLLSLADRFEQRTGRTIHQVLKS